MSDRERINTYLQTLNRYLSRLPAEDANEVIREIESHIYDAIDLAEAKGEKLEVSELLKGFGPPRTLAEKYTNHMLDGTPPPSGFSAITSIKHKVTKGMYWSTLLLGYGSGFALILLAFMKLLSPETVGIWTSPGGESVIVGTLDAPAEQGDDLLGLWLVPTALILGSLITRFTYSLLRILKRIAG